VSFRVNGFDISFRLDKADKRGCGPKRPQPQLSLVMSDHWVGGASDPTS